MQAKRPEWKSDKLDQTITMSVHLTEAIPTSQAPSKSCSLLDYTTSKTFCMSYE